MIYMVKVPRENPYHLYLRWCIQRDQLNAHFLRFGAGFITKNNMREAMELVQEVNQSLTQYRLIQVSGNGSPVVLPPLHPQELKDEKSVPRSVRSVACDNLQ